jgi:hypothetical protein
MALTGSLGCSGFAQTNSQRSPQVEPTEVKGFSDSDKAGLSRQISSAVSRGDVPGVVALIVGREGVLYEGAAGVRDGDFTSPIPRTYAFHADSETMVACGFQLGCFGLG